MSQQLPSILNVSELFQVGIVVKDLEKSINTYKTLLGMDKWVIVDVDSSEIPMTYYGKPATCSFKAAMIMAGSLMIELLQPVAGDGIYRDFLNENGEGLHHLGHIIVDNLSEAIQSLETAGFPCMETGGDPAGHGWAYVDTTEVLGYIIELSSGLDPRDLFPA